MATINYGCILSPPPILEESCWDRISKYINSSHLQADAAAAEFRYYPAPLVSVRNRAPVYGEVRPDQITNQIFLSVS